MSGVANSSDRAIKEKLKAGHILSTSQLNEFLKASEKRDFQILLSDAFTSNTDAFLRSIADTFDAQDESYKDKNVSHIVRHVVRLITPESTEAVLETCSSNLKQAETPSYFFLALYSSYGVKQKHDAHIVPVLLSFLASTETNIKDLSVLSLISLIQSSPTTESSISDYLHELLRAEAPGLSPKSFSILAASLETFFSILPDSMTAVYVSGACKDVFLYKGLLLNPENDTQDLYTAEKLLHVVSSSCIKETARKFSTEHYLPLLIAGSTLDSSADIRALSLLCIVKLWNFSAIEKQVSMESVFEKTLNSFVTAEPKTSESKYLLEALAYLSLGGAPKTALRANESALEQLVMILETSSDPSAVYGCLSVISNMCRLRRADQDKDTATLNYLKTMSADGKASEDDESVIGLFNESLVKTHKLVGTMAALKQVKNNSAVLIVDIIHSLTIKQDLEVLRAIIAQGGMNTIIKYLIEHSKISKESPSTSGDSDDERSIEIRLSALRVLATLCRTANPSLAFSKYDVKTCVPFLVELLGSVSSTEAKVPFLVDSKLGPADRLCSLLALTNLSSLSDSDLHTSIISRTFEQHLKNLMIDSSVFPVQKATWELINNLIVNPLMLAKFFNPDSPESRKILDLLVKLLHSESVPLQIVIAGLLANATMEFDLVSVSITSQKEIFCNLRKIIASIFSEQTRNDDLLLRVSSLLQSICVAASGSSALQTLREDTALKAGIKAVVITTKDANVMALIREIIQRAEMKF